MGWFCTFPVVSSAVLITQGQGVCRFLDESMPQHVRKMRGDQSCASLLLCIECCNKCSFVKKKTEYQCRKEENLLIRCIYFRPWQRLTFSVLPSLMSVGPTVEGLSTVPFAPCCAMRLFIQVDDKIRDFVLVGAQIF